MNKKINTKSVEDIVVRDLISVDKSLIIAEVAEIMAAKNIGAVLVTDEKRHYVGIFSERDLLKRVCAQEMSLISTAVEEVMTAPIITIPEYTSPMQALQQMIKSHIRHLPVTAENGKISGLLSVLDLMNAVVKILAEQNKKLQSDLDVIANTKD